MAEAPGRHPPTEALKQPAAGASVPESGPASAPKPAEKTPLPVVDIDTDARKIVDELIKAKGLAEVDYDTELTKAKQQLAENYAKPEEENPQPVVATETGTADTPQVTAPVKDKLVEGQPKMETSEKTEAEDWSEIEEAWGKNTDPVEGSAFYQVAGAYDYWDPNDTAKVDAYLKAHGVTNITAKDRSDEVSRRKSIQAAVEPFRKFAAAEKAAETEIKKYIESQLTETEEPKRVEQSEKIRQEKAKEIKDIQDKFFSWDEKTGEYTLKSDGSKVPVKAVTKTVVNEALKDLSEDKSDPKRQEKAQKNYTVLKDRIKEDGGFLPQTEATQLAKEHDRQSENAVNTAVDYIHDDLYKFITDNNLFLTDSSGHITGLKPEAYKLLEKLPDHQRVARLIILSGHYYELKDNEVMTDQRHKVAALIYKELSTMDPNQVPDALKPQIAQLKEKGNNEFLEAKYKEIADRLKKDWVGNPNYPIDEKTLTRDLFLAYFCESSNIKLVRNETTNQLELPENVTKIFGQWENRSPQELEFIEQLVSKRYIGSFLYEQFGLNLDSVAKNMDKYLDHVVGKAAERKGDESKSWLPDVLKALTDKENLKKLLKGLHLPSGIGTGAILLAVLLPSITGAMNFGLGGSSREES